MNGEKMSTQQFDESSGSVEVDTVRALEAILMVAMEPVDPSLLAQLLEQPVEVIERLCEELASAYEEAGHGFQLVKIAG
jgi:segregation and condensation protein B